METYEDRIRVCDSQTKENHKILILSHKYEYETLRIIFKEEDKFDSIVDFIDSKSQELSKISMSVVSESNRYSFGKMMIELRGIKGLVTQRDINVDVEFNPYKIKSKTIVGGKNTDVNFDQRIYIPIHNRFNLITVSGLKYEYRKEILAFIW